MKSFCVVYLASPREWRHMQWTRLECLYASLRLVRLNLSASCHIVIFHEDYTEEDKDWLRQGDKFITFTQLDFSGREYDFISARPGERVGSYGYAMMCRFLSGPMQWMNALHGFTHYIRLDDDSYIVQPVGTEALWNILAHDYTYRDNYQDNFVSLWSFTKEFCKSRGIPMNGEYSTAIPYNNFHAASLRLWSHPLVLEYIHAIENHKGCLQHGWHDTHIQSMIIRHLCPYIGYSVHIEPKVGYRHNQQCCHQGPCNPLCDDGAPATGKFHWGPPAV